MPKRTARPPASKPPPLPLPSFDACRPKETDRRAYARWVRDLKRAREQAARLDATELLLMMADQCPTMLVYFERSYGTSLDESFSPDHWFIRGNHHKLGGVALHLLNLAIHADEKAEKNRSVCTSIRADSEIGKLMDEARKKRDAKTPEKGA